MAASILVVAALTAGGQTAPEPPAVRGIEAALHNVIDSIQKGDAERTQNAFSAESRLYGIGGAAMSPVRQGAARIWTSLKACSFYVRHVQLITAESAVAVGLWRCPNAAVPQDAGTLDVTDHRVDLEWDPFIVVANHIEVKAVLLIPEADASSTRTLHDTGDDDEVLTEAMDHRLVVRVV